MKRYLPGIILYIIIIAGITANQSLKAQQTLFKPDNPFIQYTGRIDFRDPEKPRLSGAGSYIQFKCRGSSCDILLEDQNLYNNHNYISVVIDGNYQGRIRVSKDNLKYQLAKDLDDKDHIVLVCKATEAQIGYVDFLGLLCAEILPFENSNKRKIEFIGNSITCGMGLDLAEIPCDSAQWYDQHNAYLAYGPLVARQLQADWLLSSVSGIGITHNWNSPGPTMPEVYRNTFLDTNSASLWDVRAYTPDMVSICLGTNDFSDGDGTYERVPLDSAGFVGDYINFLKYIRSRYPEASICCLTSPMHSGEKSIRLRSYLVTITEYMNKVEKDDKIYLFTFSRFYTNGCSWHPDKEDHQKMAEELLPFYKKVMGW
jgi:lysophospholipase L1-like esterase